MRLTVTRRTGDGMMLLNLVVFVLVGLPLITLAIGLTVVPAVFKDTAADVDFGGYVHPAAL